MKFKLLIIGQIIINSTQVNLKMSYIELILVLKCFQSLLKTEKIKNLNLTAK